MPNRTGKILTTFRELGVLPEIADALERVGITTPFPIQEMTLSVALMGTDLIGQARTGTGKTLAFGIPVLQRTVAPHDPDYADLAAPGKPQALIVAPTRELALQVSNDMSVASADRGTRVLTVYGGVGYDNQLDTLKAGVDVVVGTPGRLIDLMNRRALDLSHIKVLVLDEADEMLDLGFLPDVERLIAKTPETRQTMLFSATMPGAIVSLARTHMRHPMNIRAESGDAQQTVPATAQFIYQVHDLDKPELIARILQAENSGLTIVFTRTKRAAQRVAEDLDDRGFDASPLHGDMQQVAREKALDAVPRGQAPGARRHRRGRPRHRRRRRHARDQLQLPRGREDLRPPDRPHRPRRRHRCRGHVRRLGRRDPLEDDQQGARAAVRGPGRDVLHLRALLPRHGHRARHQGPPQAREAGRAAREDLRGRSLRRPLGWVAVAAAARPPPRAHPARTARVATAAAAGPAAASPSTPRRPPPRRPRPRPPPEQDTAAEGDQPARSRNRRRRRSGSSSSSQAREHLD